MNRERKEGAPSWLLTLRRVLFNAARKRNPELDPRRWSNRELRKWAPHFSGDVVNVSGWRDEDKEGATYRTYFTAARSYTVTNYRGTSQADDGLEESVFLDLTQPLPTSLEGRYDVVLNHTVLEHLFDVRLAMSNLALMTRDLVILIVPFMQQEHYTDALYGDYWRFTPLGIERLFRDNGLTVVHLASNDNPWYPIYLLAIGSKQPERWTHLFSGPARDPSHRLGMSTYIYPNCIR